MMLWLKAFHIVFMVTWFSGLFYLPRLFVYHAMCRDDIGIGRFKVMERKLFYGIMTPGAVLTIVFGMAVMHFNPAYYMNASWFQLKLFLVMLLLCFHGYLGKLLIDFKRNRNHHRHTFYRWINEIPVLFLMAIVILVIVKP